MSPGVLRLSALLLTLLVASTGCGEDGASDEPSPPRPSGTSSLATPPATPTPTPPRTTTPPSEGKQKIRVVGEVTEAGDCVVVRDANDISWTLTGEPTQDLQVGDQVRATGAPDLSGTGCGGPLVRTTAVTVTDPATG